jgi:uncharacterized protein YqjF (DUF2071 family)
VSSNDFLSTPMRQAAVVDDAAHRPWPLPDAPWTNAQTWEELVFLHWRVDEAVLRPLVPSGLELETSDGSAWLTITPFRLTGFRLRGVPPLPFVSSFPELNVRTYVIRDGRPGIWFFSLDAASQLAVEGAKRLYRLPYHHARMSVDRRGGWVHYDSSRPGAAFSARYRGVGDFFRPEPGSLEEFLTERYCLYTGDEHELFRAEIHHPPWSLQLGEAAVELNTMAPEGVDLPRDEQPLIHFGARQDVVLWGLEPLTD